MTAVSEAVNARLPDWYRYVQDRQQRRQDHVAALARAAREQAANPVAAQMADNAAARAGVAEFDRREPALDYEAWKAANA